MNCANCQNFSTSLSSVLTFVMSPPKRMRPFTLICLDFWRRGRDSNPRCSFPHTRFPGVHLQPLGHLSNNQVREYNAILNSFLCYYFINCSNFHSPLSQHSSFSLFDIKAIEKGNLYTPFLITS